MTGGTHPLFDRWQPCIDRQCDNRGDFRMFGRFEDRLFNLLLCSLTFRLPLCDLLRSVPDCRFQLSHPLLQFVTNGFEILHRLLRRFHCRRFEFRRMIGVRMIQRPANRTLAAGLQRLAEPLRVVIDGGLDELELILSNDNVA